MITLKEWFETVEYKISEGGDFWWQCFGDNVYSISAWNHDHDGWSANVVFDTNDQTVYIAEVCDYKNQRAYRLFNESTKKNYFEYAKTHGHSAYVNQAWDDINFVDLETGDDWLEKAEAIVDGVEYDTRVSIPIDLPEKELIFLFKAAHEADMSFNQYIEEILRKALNDEGFVKNLIDKKMNKDLID